MLSLGNVTVNSPLVLAPMAGISDLPYRLINRSMGCAFAFTEMLSINALAYKNKNTIEKLITSPEDSPLAVQIVGREPEIIKRALDTLSEHSFSTIDFNAACPVKKVAAKGKGAGLLKEPETLQALLKLIVNYANVPVTVKIRSGWDQTLVNAVDVAVRAQDAGVKGIIIHGRTRSQGYRGTVDYDIIRQVKEKVSIPVIASGDALTPVLIKKLFDETGCDGVAIARGALGNPWIFRETEEYLKTGSLPARPDVQEIKRVMKEHFALSTTLVRDKTAILQFRKFFAWYTRGLPVRKLKVRAFQAGTRDEMVRLIDEIRDIPDTEDLAHLREIPVKYNQKSMCRRPDK